MVANGSTYFPIPSKPAIGNLQRTCANQSATTLPAESFWVNDDVYHYHINYPSDTIPFALCTLREPPIDRLVNKFLQP
jgi:hypothetical protein